MASRGTVVAVTIGIAFCACGGKVGVGDLGGTSGDGLGGSGGVQREASVGGSIATEGDTGGGGVTTGGTVNVVSTCLEAERPHEACEVEGAQCSYASGFEVPEGCTEERDVTIECSDGLWRRARGQAACCFFPPMRPPPPPPGLVSPHCSGVSSGGSSGQHGLIDDLEDGDRLIRQAEGRTGHWYVFNDGSATQTPIPFLPEGPGALGTRYAAHTTGPGFIGSQFSRLPFAVMGINLITDDGRCAYDASAYVGITFWARGPGTGELTARVNLITTEGLPPSLGGPCEIACGDFYGAEVTLGPIWQQFRIPWSDFCQRAWGTEFDFDPGHLVAITWELLGTPAVDPFDFWIDEVAFISGT